MMISKVFGRRDTGPKPTTETINQLIAEHGGYAYYVSFRYMFRSKLQRNKADEIYWKQIHERLEYLFNFPADEIDQREMMAIINEEEWDHHQARAARPNAFSQIVSVFRRA